MKRNQRKQEKRLTERAQSVAERRIDIMDYDMNRIKDTTDRLQKGSEQVEERRLFDARNQVIKSERKKIREEEVNDNALRSKRMDDYKIEKKQEREREIQEKIEGMRVQQELLQKARLESYLTSRLAQEKVYDDLIYLGGAVFNPVKKDTSMQLFTTNSKPWRYFSVAQMLTVVRVLQHVAPEEDVQNEVLGSIKSKPGLKQAGSPRPDAMRSGSIS